MNEHPRWRDALSAAERLTASDRRALLLLVRLPLIWATAVERLYGLNGGASVYRCLARLRAMGLVSELRPALRPRRNPGLLYLTDLGIATVSVDRRVDPEYLARRARLRGSDLLGYLTGLPHLVAVYQMLVALASSRVGGVDLLSWERPWRRSFARPTRWSAVRVELPAQVTVSWGDDAASCLLVPDLATFPLGVYRESLARLLALRRLSYSRFPTLVVATTATRRDTWSRLLDEVTRDRGEAPLAADITTWDELQDGHASFDQVAANCQPTSTHVARPLRLRPLRPKPPGRPIPRPVGRTLDPDVLTDHPLLRLTGMDRDLLDLIGRHSFLPAEDLSTVLGWELRRLRERLTRMVRCKLARLLGDDERPVPAEADLVELTVAGLELVAAHQGLSLARAVRYNGLAGGGSQQPIGARLYLFGNLRHTRGADAVFVALYQRLGTRDAATGGDAVIEWRNAAACSRGWMRPDGYGMVRRHGKLFGFFLEFDRGTMGYRDYGQKWSAYYRYRDSLAFARDYDGFPTILVVTTENVAEDRIARSLRGAAVGRWPPLRVLLTCTWRISDDPSNPDGLHGPIWCEPSAEFGERNCWPVQIAEMTARSP